MLAKVTSSALIGLESTLVDSGTARLVVCAQKNVCYNMGSLQTEE
jgi:hypothetical protein